MKDKKRSSACRRWTVAGCGAVVSALMMVGGCTAAGWESLSDDELVQEWLDRDWERVISQYPDAERPAAEAVRFIEPSEWAPVVAECLNELGFDDVAVTSDGGLGTDQPPDEAFVVARYKCMATYPIEPTHLREAPRDGR